MNHCLPSGLEVDILTAGLPPSAHTGRRHGVIFSKILDFSAITANELEQTLKTERLHGMPHLLEHSLMQPSQCVPDKLSIRPYHCIRRV